MPTKRFTIVIGEELNDWLVKESERTGFSKNVLCHMAIERFKEQREGMKQMKSMEALGELVNALQPEKNEDYDVQELMKIARDKQNGFYGR